LFVYFVARPFIFSEQLVKELSNLESAHRSLLSVSEQLKEAEGALAALSRTHDPEVERLRKDSEAKQRQIQSNTQKLGLLSAQRRQLASQAGSLAEIKLKRVALANLVAQYRSSFEGLQRELEDAAAGQQQQDIKRALPRNLPAEAERLSEIFGAGGAAAASAGTAVLPASYSLEPLEQLLKKQLAQLRADSKAKLDEVSSAGNHVSALSSQRRGVEEQVVALQKQLSSLRASFVAADVKALFGGASRAPLDEEVIRSDKVYEKANNEAMLGSSAKLMYKRFLAIAQESHKCHVSLFTHLRLHAPFHMRTC
jgi:predicted  nucleic acid-binding Zn-ribbon protein